MRRLVLLCWMLVPLMAPIALMAQSPGNFDARVKAANAAETDPRYGGYPTRMFEAIGAELAGATNRCMTTVPMPDSQPFALVADIDLAGRARDVAVWPDTNIARCMAAAFPKLPFPKPGKLKGKSKVPVVMNLSIVR